MNARDAILDRVRRGQKTGRIPAAAPWPIASAAAVPRPVLTDVELLARFVAELTAVGVTSYVEATAQAARERVAKIAAGKRVFRWDAERLPYDAATVLVDAIDGAASRASQAAAELGVTGCDAAIAETGSLALISGRGKPRAASLLPPAHLAIVRRADLRYGMGEFFEERAADIAGAANCTFVTGPSRTADIELTLTLGAHGPGTLVVVVGP